MSRSASSTVYGLTATLLLVAALPLLPLLLLTSYRRHLGERFGRLSEETRRLRRPLWLHAASVGEVLAAEPLVTLLRRSHPELPILMSTTSLTGRETARTRLSVDAVTLLPADVPCIVRRVVRTLRPTALVVMETELWPALFAAAATHGVPCAIVSGRVSPGAARRYAWWRWLFAPALARVSVFAMQTAEDAARIAALGAPQERVHVLGSLKFARQASAVQERRPAAANRPFADGRPLLVAASTHLEEETMVLDACASLWIDHPEILLLIAPRRPERFDDVDRLLSQSGVRHARRSRSPGSVRRDTQVLLLDTIGELLDALPEATAVFVGGTMVDVGGHNVLEPALFGKPVAFGPRTENVTVAAEALLRREAATRVRDAGELQTAWKRFLENPQAARDAGERGRAVVNEHAVVAERTLQLLQPLLSRAEER
jgi:3-deoxy-D-manno-octulosonic-acid transferase